jgi:hypothetical protein
MTTDPRTRAAVDDLWASTVADPDAGLASLMEVHSRRRPQSRASTAALVAVAVAAAWWGGSTFGAHRSVTPDPALVPSNQTQTQTTVCAEDRVTCRGGRDFRFALSRPVDWHIPVDYGVASGDGVSSSMVESYSLRSAGGSGVTVMEGARAASRSSGEVPGGPTTGKGFVRWLAARPFLTASTPRRTTIDGRDAWQVRVALRPHLPEGPGWCNGSFQCYPVISVGGAITGIWRGVVADYTAFDLPGAGTAVVWSWSLDDDPRALEHNQTLVSGLSWPSS